ncbi:response regulator [Rubripirellula reticaptiva]|uniref:Transcriptional regulatory protein WalR n=1 Tax=Rubripirellula reticaptiva TaxID=2528013 RepID=A0A5C6EB60_9BACT|nr:response regulator [Rubripirellula reticaptiva]TWU46973.1 Transcriptional regulatory protein WalR [Rubripirellula reticaptiva]
MIHHLLLVEDDLLLAEMVREFLSEHGFDVTVETNGNAAINRIESGKFDAVVLDIGLPGTDGFNVCRSVRPKFTGPIIVLTARGEEIDEVIALEVGADDFVAKPVRPRALLARLKVHLRRGDTTSSSSSDLVTADSVIEVGDLTIEPASRSVLVAGENVDLTTAEYDLLYYLALRAGTIVQRKQVYIDLLEFPYDGLDRSIDLRISRLRRKLNDDPNQPTRIKSIRGVGYLMAKPV